MRTRGSEWVATRDVRTLTDILDRGRAVTSLDQFPRFVVDNVPRLVPCDSISYNEVDVERPRLVSLMEPAAARFVGDAGMWERYMRDHPLVSRYLETRDGRAFKITDLVPQRQFRRGALYRQVYRPLRTEYQMAFNLPSPPPLMIGIALNRERRDFGERDRTLLNLLRPHLVQMHRQAETHARVGRSFAALERAAERDGAGVVAMTVDGRVEHVTPRARSLLTRWFDGSTGGLPEELRRWQRRQRDPFAGGFETPPPAEPLVLERAGRRLVVRFLPALRATDDDALVLEETRVAREGVEHLTPRELAVMRRVARGETNADIAAALGLSVRTVAKHLERTFAKLRVRTRTAAVARLFGEGEKAPRG